MGRDVRSSLSKKYVPLVLTFLAFVGVSLPSLRIRPVIYSYNSTVPPYQDTGFELSPDWSTSPHLINEGFATGYIALLVLFVAIVGGSRGGTSRATIVRRWMFAFVCAEILQLAQMLSTVFPDPNPNLRFLEESRRWAFMMYPILYSVGAMTVQFNTTIKPVIVAAHLISLIGCFVLIPTRYLYTVDMLSALIAGIYPFLVYHWYVRTTLSIHKRPFLRWFEQDALSEASIRASVKVSLLASGGRGAPGSPYGGTAVGSGGSTGSSGSPMKTIGGSFVGTNGSITSSSGGAAYVSMESPATDFGLNEFRAPTFVGKERETQEEELIERVAMLTHKERLKWALSAWASTLVLGIVAATGTYFAVHMADHRRPVHNTPLAKDVLFNIIPPIPDHTADIFLYVQCSLVTLGTLYSSERFHILRRTAFMFCCIMLMRCVTLSSTFPPDPSPICAKKTHESGTTCGDLIFSGHTISFLLTAFIVHYYCKIKWLEVVTWLWTTAGLVVIVASRLHYTRDVVTALIVGFCTIHLCHVSFFQRPDRKLSYTILFWFEFDQAWWMWHHKFEEEKKQIADFTSTPSATPGRSTTPHEADEEDPSKDSHCYHVRLSPTSATPQQHMGCHSPPSHSLEDDLS